MLFRALSLKSWSLTVVNSPLDLVFRLSAYHMQYACYASYATDFSTKSTDNITLRLVIVSFVHISLLYNLFPEHSSPFSSLKITASK